MKIRPASLLVLSGLVLLFLPTSSLRSGEPRIWKDRTGKFEVVAELVDVREGKVHLRRRDDGVVVHVPLTSLSDSDKALVANLAITKRLPARTRAIPITASALAAEANKKRTAKVALTLYQEFLESPEIDEREREVASKAIGRWELSAKLGLVRRGSQWMSPNDANLLVKRESDLLQLTDEAVSNDDLATAEKWLLESSAANPDGIRGYFRLGLAKALNSWRRDGKKADECFSKCVARRYENADELTDQEKWNLAAALNNLALAKLRQRRVGEAIQQWMKLLQVRAMPKAALHNIARLRTLIEPASRARRGGPDKFYPSDPELKLLAKLESQLFNLKDAYNEKRGWRYLPLVEEREGVLVERPTSVARAAQMNPQLVAVAMGSGVAITERLILTNRHVVEHAKQVEVASEVGGNKLISANIVHISDDASLDLAVIECPHGVLPASFANWRPKLSTEVRALGFPEPDNLGVNIKVTHGVITALPPLVGIREVDLLHYLMHDAVILGGSSGGPICNRHGLIIGINTAFQDKLSLAVPAERCIPYIQSHLSDFQPAADTEPELSWEDAVERVRRATVRVVCLREADSFSAVTTKLGEVTWDRLDDPWCVACYGANALECPDRNCGQGTVRGYRKDVHRFPDGSAILENKPIRVKCNVCNGKGMISCRYCKYGFDDTFVDEVTRQWLLRYIATLIQLKELGLLD